MELPEPIKASLEFMAAGIPLALLAALGGIVRAMQAGKCGMKAVAVAALSSTFAGIILHLFLSQTSWPLTVQAALCGLAGYASGELLKIATVRMCRWADSVGPGGVGGK